jgi:hypothetical protein
VGGTAGSAAGAAAGGAGVCSAGCANTVEERPKEAIEQYNNPKRAIHELPVDCAWTPNVFINWLLDGGGVA